MQRTNIEWTNFSANPLKYRNEAGEVVWACIHKSEGCRNCYSEKIAMRYKRGGPFTAPVMEELTPFLDEKELHHMLTYKPASGKMCFVGDMTDIFGEWVPDELVSQLFAVFCLRPDVRWQLLTKRPERMQALLSDEDFASEVDAFAWEQVEALVDPLNRRSDDMRATAQSLGDGPLPNVHLGISCEDQKTADERIPLLLQTPAAVRFVSYEPALGPVDFTRLLVKKTGYQDPSLAETSFDALRGSGTYPSHVTGIPIQVESDRLNWLIAGSESGPKARDYETEWFANVARQCEQAGVKFFMKQLTVRGRKIPFEQWPGYLQVREFPGHGRMFVERK